jgi:hypothetical protein
MKEMTNRVVLQGTLIDTSLEIKVDTQNKRYIAGNVEIMTDEGQVVPVSVFAYEFKKTGEVSKAFENVNKVMNMPTVAGFGTKGAAKLSLTSGRLEDNAFFSEKDSKVVSAWRIGGMFFRNAAQDSQAINEFEVEGVVSSIKEIMDNEGVATGTYELKLLNVGYNDRVNELSLKFKDPTAIDYITTAYNPGDKVTLSGKVIYEIKEKTVEKETAFGKPVINTYTNTTKSLLITAGTEPTSPEEHGIKLKTLLQKIQDNHKDIQERFEAKNQKSFNVVKDDIKNAMF